MKLRKFISAVLIAAVVTGTLTFNVFAQQADSDEYIYEQAYELAAALGIAAASEPGDLSADMTRGEFCAMVAKLINAGSYDKAVYRYTDVPASHEYSDEIYILSDLKAVSGYGDDIFAPDEAITVNQAAAIIIKAFNYTAVMKTPVSYPVSYIAQADKLDILDYVESSGEEPLSRGEAFAVIRNACLVPVPEFSSYDGENIEFVIDNDSTALSEYHGISRLEGICDSNCISTLSGASKTKCAEGKITVNGHIYSISDSEYKSYLGYNVEIFADDDDKILYMRPYDNEVLAIDFEDAISFETGYISYFKNNTEKRISISKNVDLLYNSVAYPDYKPGEFDFQSAKGTITLIDSTGDSKYDCIKIDEYETYIVNYVDDSDKTLYYFNYKTPDTVNGNTQEIRHISFADADVIDVVRSDGAQIPFSLVLTNEAASVFKSKDGSYVRIISSPEKLNGTLISVSDDKLEIQSEDTTVAEYKTDCRDVESINTLVPGYAGTFILSFKGEVCGVTDYYGDGFTYGYLVRVAETGSFKSILKVKVLCADREMRIFTFDNNCKIDGKKYTDMEKAYEALTKTDTTNGKRYTASQIIRYKTSSDGERITYIDTASVGESENDDSTLSVKSVSNAGYRPSQLFVQRKLMLTNDVTVFLVPKLASGSPSDIEKADDDDYSVTYSMKNFWVRENITLDAAMIDKDGCISDCAAVYYDFYPQTQVGGNRLYYNTSITVAMVDYVGTKVNAQGEEVAVIHLLTDAEIVAKECASIECALKNVYENGVLNTEKTAYLSKGDVIGCHFDDNGILQYTELLYDASRTDNKRFQMAKSATVAYSCGIPYTKSAKGMQMSATVHTDAPEYDRTNPEATFDLSTASLFASMVPETNIRFFVYDSEEDVIRKGNMYDIKDYKNNPDDTSMLFIKESYTVPSVICIYN